MKVHSTGPQVDSTFFQKCLFSSALILTGAGTATILGAESQGTMGVMVVLCLAL